MKCLRIYATPDGESHFDEVELPTTKRSVHPDAVPFDVTASYQASRVRLTHIPAGMREVAWHRVPEPVLTPVSTRGSATPSPFVVEPTIELTSLTMQISSFDQRVRLQYYWLCLEAGGACQPTRAPGRRTLRASHRQSPCPMRFRIL